MDIEYIPKEIGKKWLGEATEISAMLSGLIKTKKAYLQAIDPNIYLSFASAF